MYRQRNASSGTRRPPLSLLCALLLAGVVASDRAARAESLALDGAGDYVRVAHDPGLHSSGGITIEAWVRQTGNAAACQTIVGKDFRSSYWLGLCGGRLRFYASGAWDGNRVVRLGEWTHVAVTFDGTTRRYYVNGFLDFELATPGEVGVNDHDLGIGAEAFLPPGASERFPFQGNLAEVRIWDRARSRDEIRRDLVRRVSEDRPDLIAGFALEGSGDEVFGRFAASFVGDAALSGLAPPLAVGAPLRIPRFGGGFGGESVPRIDGSCALGEYGPLRFPVWIDSPTVAIGERLVWVSAAASGSDLYLCFQGIPKRSATPGLDPFAAVYLDLDGDGGAIAAARDLRFLIGQGGDYSEGAGDGRGSYPVIPRTGATAAVPLDAEFDWSAEYRIPRSLLPASDAVFGIGLGAQSIAFVGDDHGFPAGFDWQGPGTWELVQIDDSLRISRDWRVPEAFVEHRPERPAADGSVTIRAVGQDTNDIASVSIWVDAPLTAPPARICDFGGENDFSAVCELSTRLPAGPHTYFAEARDSSGKVDYTARRSLRTVLGGSRPRLDLALLPPNPTPGGSATLRVTARDAAGIARIRIDGLPRTPPVELCTSPASSTTASASCSASFVVPAGARSLRLDVEAENRNGFIARGSRTALFGNGGPDGDGDGIADAIEETLCTDPTNADSDGDALADGWEILGLTPPGTSRRVDLPALGANPCRKDVFLQYDYERGARVDPFATEELLATFLRRGVALHLETNERPRPTSGPSSPLGAVEAAFQIGDRGAYWFPPERNWTHTYAYSRHQNGRSGAWGRYFTFDIYLGQPGTCNCPLTADPTTCQFGAPNPGCGREGADGQARRFVHELGHALGLGHGGRSGTRELRGTGGYLWYTGGWDNSNHKPNYQSAMNYTSYGGRFCQAGVDLFGSLVVPRFVSELDYSDRDLGSLDESALDERPTSVVATRLRAEPCFLATPGSFPVVGYTCFDPDTPGSGSDANGRYFGASDGRATLSRRRHQVSRWDFDSSGTAHAPGIDWDCDGAIEASVAGSVNGDGGDFLLPDENETCNGRDDNGNGAVDEGCGWRPGELLSGHDDWPAIPSPPSCVKLHTGTCYPQPDAYRAGMGDAPDCRGDGLPAGTCTAPIAFPPSASYTPVQEDEAELPPPLPNTESCNGVDDDADLEIDEGCVDRDGDTVSDGHDNCPETANADQTDLDADGLGDACQLPGPPQDLQQTVTPNGTLLTWAPHPDVAGWVVTRLTDGDPTPRYLGTGYPSASAPSFFDPPNGAAAVRYAVRAVDRLGQEGPPAEVGAPIDGDGDGRRDAQDTCPGIPDPEQKDTDADGVGDACDTCLLVASADQRDSDADGFGNACDADYDQNGIVGLSDFNRLRRAFGSRRDLDPGYDPAADHDGDGVIGLADFNRLRGLFGRSPGPTGLAAP